MVHVHTQGPLVYVNYGRASDFRYLNETLHLNLTGSICIVRYGAIFRGYKVYCKFLLATENSFLFISQAQLAQMFGCKGLLLYFDPLDYAPEGVKVYPDGPALPEYGVQRGTLHLSGDILSPSVPSICQCACKASCCCCCCCCYCCCCCCCYCCCC